MPFRLHNRLDVYDLATKQWRECNIVEISGNHIKVHYKGFASRYDEVLDTVKDAERIREVGSFSNAEGWAKHSLKHQQEIRHHRFSFHKLAEKAKKTFIGGAWNLEPPT